jgi:hypothetical protein
VLLAKTSLKQMMLSMHQQFHFTLDSHLFSHRFDENQGSSVECSKAATLSSLLQFSKLNLHQLTIFFIKFFNLIISFTQFVFFPVSSPIESRRRTCLENYLGVFFIPNNSSSTIRVEFSPSPHRKLMLAKP